MSATMKALRDILTEMFGEDRVAALPDDAKPWHDVFAMKTIDKIDFKCFVQEKFGILPHIAVLDMFGDTSLAQIAKYIETTTPNTNPY